ncbi:hypothetical protein [uncultured Cohaesibacter sp.]|uniref:hypothetical protein n=1 Tax=uncultured Cohaesibacter sp. TaxID=1002546 RepID=UPI00292F3BD8|nr:hypothetical protein [uncultured Cohaesibacter sp.]
MKQPSAKYRLSDQEWTIECGKAFEQYQQFTNGLKAKGVHIDAFADVVLKEALQSYYFGYGAEETAKMIKQFCDRVGMSPDLLA